VCCDDKGMPSFNLLRYRRQALGQALTASARRKRAPPSRAQLPIEVVRPHGANRRHLRHKREEGRGRIALATKQRQSSAQRGGRRWNHRRCWSR
jgi:hypothetical protein